MDISRETLDRYHKNLWSLRDITDQLVGTMHGQTISFRSMIADRSGKLDQKKLTELIEEMLSDWAEHVREGVYPDKPGAESAAEPYLRARQELYGTYLYLTMQCCLCTGAFALAGGDEEDPERQDFAYLLDHAKRFAKSWCVLEDPDGTRHNIPYQGYDSHFGFHLYHAFTDPEERSGDSYLTPSWKMPSQDLSRITNLGNVKRIHCKALSPRPAPEPAPEQTAPAAQEEEEDEWDPYADFGDDEDYDPLEDGWDSVEMPIGVPDIPVEEFDAVDRQSLLLSMGPRLGDHEEDYIIACKRFVSLYEQADSDVLRGFYEDLEEIVNLYLLGRDFSPLASTDNTLDVYCRVFDDPLEHAKRYARGVKWKHL